jgi:hypothetical protein
MKLRKGASKEATETLIMSLDNEIIDKEKELDALKKEVKFLRGKLEEEERR